MATEEKFSLKDHLFNAESVGRLAREYSDGIPGFDGEAFATAALSGFETRELMERLDWMADCLESQLPAEFPAMAEALEAAMPSKLDPSSTDDDFGHFIHALPGILAVRHGLENHRDRALDLLYEATQRFSMEFYIRPFLNRWQPETLARMEVWAKDDNYHVRRLVSEGTRPRLPWAKSVTLTPDQTLPLLNTLHADPTRYVTRSVANHLNDMTRIVPDQVFDLLESWRSEARQNADELEWMIRHALRTQIKEGTPRALKLLGFDPKAKVDCELSLTPNPVKIGDMLEISLNLSAPKSTPVLVDYLIDFPSASGKRRQKVFKLKQARIKPGTALKLQKNHRLKGGASTFTLVPGPHHLTVQINGCAVAQAGFEVVDAT